MKRALTTLLLILCTLLFLFACCQLFRTYREYEDGTTTYEELDDVYTTVLPTSIEPQLPESDEPPIVQETAPITVDFESLSAQYPDVVAWIYCPDTIIDYPIMQAENNDKYLRSLPDGTWNIAGTLFMDYRNAKDFSDSNSIIYGHNMKNDSMFGTLPDYSSQEHYEANPHWYLLTPIADYKIELIAGYVTHSTSEAYAIPETQEEKENLIQTAFVKSDFTAEVEIAENEKLITLSTCSYEYDDARYVLVGVLKELAKLNNDETKGD